MRLLLAISLIMGALICLVEVSWGIIHASEPTNKQKNKKKSAFAFGRVTHSTSMS